MCCVAWLLGDIKWMDDPGRGIMCKQPAANSLSHVPWHLLLFLDPGVRIGGRRGRSRFPRQWVRYWWEGVTSRPVIDG